MKSPLVPLAALFLLSFCSSGDDRRAGETATAGEDSAALSGRDTMQAPAAPAGSGLDSSTTPAAILSQMNVANTIEIQLARIASRKATSPEVKRVAEKLAVDHSKNRQRVRALGQTLNVPVTPAAGGDVSAADSIAMPADLQGKTGAEFDQAFVEYEIRDHENSIRKIQSQLLPAAQDPRIKTYLLKTVAEMQGHLASLNEVEQKIGS